jgi:NAD(P)-dependent dehydrogenase (short-subunit alcohol dehydrogenase family)
MSGTILVFGGAGGIGQAVARSVKARGYTPHLVGRNAERVAAVASDLQASYSVADVTDEASMAKAVEEAVAGGALAGLCYAVGTINLKPVTRLSDEDVMRDFRVNATGAFHAVKAALPALKSYEGTASVLLFSTVAVAQGFTAHASVAMAKGAVEGLTLSLAAELAPKIRVNCIAPSLTKTPLAAQLLANETMATAIAGLHAMQRLGEADDIAPLASLLLSDEAGWITGQIIGVDGGRSQLRTKG